MKWLTLEKPGSKLAVVIQWFLRVKWQKSSVPFLRGGGGIFTGDGQRCLIEISWNRSNVLLWLLSLVFTYLQNGVSLTNDLFH